MNAVPEISVIVPVYNAEPFLTECIESIIKQDFDKIEILLINDGSTDRSGIICNNLASQDSRIRTFHTTNEGVISARKKGLQLSQGQWIVFVDADDTISINQLSVLYHNATSHNCDLVKASMINTLGKQWAHRNLKPMDRDTYIRSILEDTTYAYLCCSIYRKSLFDDFSFPEDTSLKIGEDILSSLLLAKNLNKAMNINDILYLYRTNQDSVMSQRIPHPDYWKRYYDQTLILLDTLNIPADIRKKIETLSLTRQIKAFLEPEVSFEKVTFERIRQQILRLDHSYGFKSKYKKYLLHPTSARILKYIKYAQLQSKGYFKFGRVYKRQLLY